MTYIESGDEMFGGAEPFSIHSDLTEEGDMSTKKAQQQKKTRSATTRRKAIVKRETATTTSQ